MNYKTYQQLLTKFFEYHDILFGQNKFNLTGKRPSTRKRGHLIKTFLKRRRRNKIAKETRRKQR
ncbi:MAG: hypothetical protein ACTSSF_00360 [Candidatus Heimdallarchaeaceae archaeon]